MIKNWFAQLSLIAKHHSRLRNAWYQWSISNYFIIKCTKYSKIRDFNSKCPCRQGSNISRTTPSRAITMTSATVPLTPPWRAEHTVSRGLSLHSRMEQTTPETPFVPERWWSVATRKNGYFNLPWLLIHIARSRTRVSAHYPNHTERTYI